MAKNENIGGFWYSLGIDTDKGAFARAGEAINGLVNTFKTAAAILGVGFTIKTTVQGATEVYLMSERLKADLDTLKKWEIATKDVGGNFRGIASEMQNVQNKLAGMDLGEFDSNWATRLAQLGINKGFDDIRSMSITDLTQMIIDEALKKSASGALPSDTALKLVTDLLGPATAEVFTWIKSGIGKEKGWGNVADWLAYGEKHTIGDQGKATEAIAGLGVELNTLKTTAATIWTSIFGEMSEKWLGPGTRAINDWIAKNKPNIERGIKGAFDAADKAVTKIFEFFEGETWAGIWSTMKDTWTVAVESAKWIWEHTIGYTPPPVVLDDEQAGELNSEFYKTYGVGPDIAARAAADLFQSPGSAQDMIDLFKQALPMDMVADIIAEYNRLVESAPTKEDYMKEMGGFKGSWAWLWEGMWSGHAKKVKDGIVKPGGGIVQVDRNDWVLAFKNLGDLLPAFGGAGAGAGGNTANVTISQNFTLNGNVMPGQVREAAYRGTSSAMSELFTRAGAIVQMMPATR